MATSDDFLPKITPVYTLTGADRCDAGSCGARAYIRATITLGMSDLLFCGHHGAHHKPKLIDLVHDWVDETGNIIAKRLPTDQYVSY